MTTTNTDGRTAQDRGDNRGHWDHGGHAGQWPADRLPRHTDRAGPRLGWAPPSAEPAPVAPTPRRARRSRWRWRDREGHYELRVDPALSTTRQAEVLNLALASRPSTHERLLFGTDVITEQCVYLDQFLAYRDPADPTSDVGVSVLGDIGAGKSTAMKAQFLMRSLLLGRYVVVLDKKLQGTEGEYAPIARLLGTEPVRFVLGGGGSRINLLDPAIGVGLGHRDSDDATSAGAAGQLQLLRAVLAESMDRSLTPREGKALRVSLVDAHARARAERRVAVVADLVWCLRHPQVHAVDDDLSAAQLREWGLDLALALEGFVDDELQGLVDGPTSPEVTLDHPARLTVFDISALPTDGPALPIVMLLIQTWLTSLLAQRAANLQQTVLIVEEGWHVAAGGLGKVFQKNVKLSRGTGLSTVAGFHRPSDLPPDSPARALLQEAGTLLVFRQGRPEDAAATAEIANLDPALAARLTTLPTGQCIVVRKNQDPIWVQVARSGLETELTSTDDELTGQRSGATGVYGLGGQDAGRERDGRDGLDGASS